ncbi:HHIP-like protein 2 [Mizuhopecten yessoensis]|uniref:HHIP-like protein 2 n=1 Tax=Mizuhopecten yessoensis TaxID=6573 RepID=A0A210PVX3_MIZYE|nr:HHIP-like protein 2 [Mizuhopecten yessoensis]OWF40648.1 HHIP-like protein 2 [Mizuhopecten yessoensis]
MMATLVRWIWGIVVVALTIPPASTVSYTTTCVCLSEPVQSGDFHSPVAFIQDNERYLVAEQSGKVHSYSLSWRKYEVLFLDMRDKVSFDPNTQDERGLLNLALHPQFSDNRKLYTFSVRTLQDGHDYVIVSELQEKNGYVDTKKEKILLTIQQTSPYRNGGALLFGPDGYLYVGVGDGGTQGNSGNEQLATQAQDKHNLLGKILRINVNTLNYTVPSDNPFVNGNKGQPEIFAYGFRNTFRCSFDKYSNELFCGDNGNHHQNEVDVIRKGRNYGWNIKEGDICLAPGQCEQLADEEKPIFTYNNSNQYSAVIGGYVYRGKAFRLHWLGDYIFGDFSGGLLRLVRHNDKWQSQTVQLCPISSCPCDARAKYGQYLHSFGQDDNGELYIITSTFNEGKQMASLLKLVPPSPSYVTCSGTNIQFSADLTLFIFLAVLFLTTALLDT